MSATIIDPNKKEKTGEGTVTAPVQNSVVPTTANTGAKTYGDYLAGGNAPAAGTGYSSYGDYLAGNQNKVHTPSVTAAVGGGYGAWLENRQKNYKAANTPTGANSYGEYLAGLGVDPAGEYRQQVASSYGDYLAGLPAYGQQGERMAKAGLVGSGYGDYLAGKAYEQLMTGKREAQKTASENLKATYASYGDYLAGITQQNEAAAATEAANKDAAFAVLSQAVTTYGSLDAAVAALRGGQYDKYIDDAVARYQGVMSAQSAGGVSTVTGTTNLTGSTDLTGSTVNAEELANATSDILGAMENGASFDSASAILDGIYSTDTLDQVKSNVQESNIKNYEQVIVGNAGGVQNYGQILDDGVRNGSYGFAIGDENYNLYLKQGYDKNWEFIEKALNGNLDGIRDYASAVGLDISAGSAEQVDKVIDHMAHSGAITAEMRHDYYKQQTLNSYKTLNITSKEAASEVQTLQDMVTRGEITEAQRKELLSALGARLDQLIGSVTLGGIDWNNLNQKIFSKERYLLTTVYYDQGENGGEGINLRFNPWGASVSGEGFRQIWRKDDSAIGVIGTKIVMEYKGKYYEADYDNTWDNAGFVAWALTHA